tara:strand:- start:31 stop:252 length:222 start_codon:yes stop_codon:yes gene_type:complete
MTYNAPFDTDAYKNYKEVMTHPTKDLTLGDLEALKSLILFHDDWNELEENIGTNVEDLYNKINNLMLDHRLES